MNQNQLHKARQTRWRQDGNALLTLDDAERWLAETPLCLYLPRHQHLPVPAPSFVEAIAGRPDPTPAPAEIAAASQMLARLVASGAVIAFNLFGSPSGIVGEQPDFLATPEALPYLYALQPERNPKRPPSTRGAARVSPLAAESFQILTREGALTAAELRERLGREVTEAATLRALGELWHAMRVVPVPDEEGAPTHWELLSARHGRELNIGSTESQTTALSILVSFYLQSVIAATADETEIFLSPLASRSRIRDVIHGLSTTRQLASFSLNGEAQLYVEGTLPEIPEEEAEPIPALEADAVPQETEGLDAGLEQNEPSIIEATASTPVRFERKPKKDQAPKDRRPNGQRGAARRSFTDRARSFKPRQEEGGFRRPARGAFSKERSEPGRFERPERHFDRRPDRPQRQPDQRFERPAAPEKSFRRGDKYQERESSFERPQKRRFAQPGPRRTESSGTEAAPGGKRERRPFRRDNERRPFSREERRPFRKEDREPRPFRRRDEGSGEGRPPRREGRPYPPSGQRRSSAPIEGERRPFRKESREQRSFSSRPFRRRDNEPGESRPPRREGRPFSPAGQRRGPAPTGGERRPFRREDREQRPSARPFRRPFQRDDERGEARPPRREDRPRFGDRERRPYPPSSQRPTSGQRRGPTPAGGERRPFRKPTDRFQSGDRPRSGFKPRGSGEGAPPDFRKPFGKSFGKPGNRPPSKGNFRFKGKNPESNRPGGFTSRPRRNKPRKESGEGDEG